MVDLSSAALNTYFDIGSSFSVIFPEYLIFKKKAPKWQEVCFEIHVRKLQSTEGQFLL